MSAPDRNGGFGTGSGSGRYVILDLCRPSGRIRVISPQGEDPSRDNNDNGVPGVAEGEVALIRTPMALAFPDFPLPSLEEEEEELSSSISLADRGDGCELSAEGESDTCDYGDEDAEELDALLESSDDDDDDDGDSLRGCGRSKRARIRQRFLRLRSIVGAERCMDTVAVFDEVILYLKALQLQARSQDSRGDAGIVPDG